MPNLKLNIPRRRLPRRISGAPVFRRAPRCALRAGRAAPTRPTPARRGVAETPAGPKGAPRISPTRGTAAAPRRTTTRAAPTAERISFARDAFSRFAPKELPAPRAALSAPRPFESFGRSAPAPRAAARKGRPAGTRRFPPSERADPPAARVFPPRAAGTPRAGGTRLPARAAGARHSRRALAPRRPLPARRPIEGNAAPAGRAPAGAGPYSRSEKGAPTPARRDGDENDRAALRELRRIASLLNGIRPVLREDRVLDIE